MAASQLASFCGGTSSFTLSPLRAVPRIPLLSLHVLATRLAAAEEETHEEEQTKRGGWERAAMALGRPVTKQSCASCRLHLQVWG